VSVFCYDKFMKIILVDAVNTFVTEGEIFKELHNLLEAYSNKKIIVTNANDEQMETFGLTNLPYDLFTLRHNPDKPDPVYFEELLKHYNLKSENCIYFEHNEDAVKSAESVGITSYHYNHEEKDLDRLKKFLDGNM
jgi:HAD superfamily hydrolase (TIGR01509 family)